MRLNRRTVRSILVGTLLSTFIVSGLTGGSVSNAAEDGTISDAADFSSLQSCMNSPKASLNIVYIMDKSSSMKENDKDFARSAMAESTLRILQKAGANLASGEVNYAYVGFGNGATKKGWAQLTEESLPDELVKVGILARGQDDNGTDWRAGLLTAKELITQKHSENSNSCFVALWMTDGQIDLNFGGSGFIDATGDAFRDICATDGLIDWYRNPENKVSLLAALLSKNEKAIAEGTPEASQLTMHEKSVLLFEAVVKGKSNISIPSDVIDGFGLANNLDESKIYTCGSVRNNSNMGHLVKNGDAADLSWEFVDLVAGITNMQKVVPENDSFSVPSAIGKIHIYVKGAESRTLSLLDANKNDVCNLPEVNCNPSGAMENGTYTLFDIDIPKAGSETGSWKVSLEPKSEDYKVYVGLDGAYKKIELQGILEPSKTEYIEGFPINATFTVVDQDGQMFPPGFFDSTEICQTSPAPQDQATCPSSPAGFNFSVSESDKNISAQATLKIPNIDKPFKVSSSQSISVTPGLQFAKFACTEDSRCPLSPIPNKKQKSHTKLLIKGGIKGTSNVKVIDFIAEDIPERADSYKATSASVEVTEGTDAFIDVYLSNPKAKEKEKNIKGYIVYEVSNGAEKIIVQAPVTFSIDQNKSWAAIIIGYLIAILLGIGLPYAALLIQARRSAVFIDDDFRFLTVPVALTSSGQLVSPSDSGSSEDLGGHDAEETFVPFETPDRKLLSKSVEIEKGVKTLQIGVANLHIKPVRFDAFAPIHVSLTIPNSVVSSNQGDLANMLLLETTSADQSLNGLVYLYASSSIVDPIDKSTFHAVDESLEDLTSDGSSMSLKSERSINESLFAGMLVVTFTGTHNYAKALEKISESLRGKNFESLNKSLQNLRIEALDSELQATNDAAKAAGTDAKGIASAGSNTNGESSEFKGSIFEDEFADFMDKSSSETNTTVQNNNDDEF